MIDFNQVSLFFLCNVRVDLAKSYFSSFLTLVIFFLSACFIPLLDFFVANCSSSGYICNEIQRCDCNTYIDNWSSFSLTSLLNERNEIAACVFNSGCPCRGSSASVSSQIDYSCVEYNPPVLQSQQKTYINSLCGHNSKDRQLIRYKKV